MKATVLALSLALLGCARAATPPPQAPSFGGFVSEGAREMACLDMRDHLVDLYSDAYLKESGTQLDPRTWTAFRDAWAEELAKKGTFQRFEESCFATLTPAQFKCAEAVQDTEGFNVCMSLGPRRR